MNCQVHERAGRIAEAAAAWHLRLHGYRILARRFATPVGEIDLVAQRRNLLVFVEVKRRATVTSALAALLPLQQRCLENLILSGRLTRHQKPCNFWLVRLDHLPMGSTRHR